MPLHSHACAVTISDGMYLKITCIYTFLQLLRIYFCVAGVRYWQLDISQLKGGKDTWDKAVADASEEYKGHMVSGHRNTKVT